MPTTTEAHALAVLTLEQKARDLRAHADALEAHAEHNARGSAVHRFREDAAQCRHDAAALELAMAALQVPVREEWGVLLPGGSSIAYPNRERALEQFRSAPEHYTLVYRLHFDATTTAWAPAK